MRPFARILGLFLKISQPNLSAIACLLEELCTKGIRLLIKCQLSVDRVLIMMSTEYQLRCQLRVLIEGIDCSTLNPDAFGTHDPIDEAKRSPTVKMHI